jgi:hypothetical protein
MHACTGLVTTVSKLCKHTNCFIDDLTQSVPHVVHMLHVAHMLRRAHVTCYMLRATVRNVLRVVDRDVARHVTQSCVS